MQCLFLFHDEDKPALTALFSRLQTWGYLTYFDMDAVFEGVLLLLPRMFLMEVLPGLDWPVFSELLQRLRAEGDRALPFAEDIQVIVLEEGKPARLLDYRSFLKRIEKDGKP